MFWKNFSVDDQASTKAPPIYLPYQRNDIIDKAVRAWARANLLYPILMMFITDITDKCA